MIHIHYQRPTNAWTIWETLRHFQPSTWIPAISILKLATPPLRKERSRLTTCYTNWLLCHSSWRMTPPPFSESWAFYCPYWSDNLPLLTTTTQWSSRDNHVSTSTTYDLSSSFLKRGPSFWRGKVSIIYKWDGPSWTCNKLGLASIAEHTMNAKQDLKKQTTKTELRSFMCLHSFFRRFFRTFQHGITIDCETV